MFKDKLKELREKEGLSQQELADKLFVSRSAVAKWENGNGIPSDVNLDEICKFFDIDKKQLKLKKEDLNYTKKKKFNFLRHLLYFVIIDLLIIFIGVFIIIDAHKDKKQYYDDIIFYENSIVIKNTSNFKINKENIKILKERFDYVNCVAINSINVHILNVYENGSSQPIDINPVSSNFIYTGVITYDRIYDEFIEFSPQKIELLYGKTFDDESDKFEIVIDLDTSLLCFGKENSVGEFINTKYGKFEIIGVVSNTQERELTKEINDYKGAERIYDTYGYISHKLAKKIIENGYSYNYEYAIEEIIISDKEKSSNEIKHIVEILFNIPEDDLFTITTRDKLLDLYTYEINVKTNILYIVSSALILSALIGGLLFFKVFNEYKKLSVTK